MGTALIVKIVIVIAGLVTGYVNRDKIADTGNKVINIVLTVEHETNDDATSTGDTND